MMAYLMFYEHGKVNYEAFDPPSIPEPAGDFIWWQGAWRDRKTVLADPPRFMDEVHRRSAITLLLADMITDTTVEVYAP